MDGTTRYAVALIVRELRNAGAIPDPAIERITEALGAAAENAARAGHHVPAQEMRDLAKSIERDQGWGG